MIIIKITTTISDRIKIIYKIQVEDAILQTMQKRYELEKSFIVETLGKSI